MLPIIFTLALDTTFAPGPPDGTYSYTETFQGQPAGKTTVTVKRDASSITASESASISAMGHAIAGTNTLTLGASTLAPATYDATYAIDSARTVHARLNVSGSSASESNDLVGPKSFSLATGVKGFAVVDGGFMSGTMFLPAQEAIAHGAPLLGVVPSFGVSLPISAGAAFKPDRPHGVPAADSVLAVAGQQPFNVWYDPKTMVVDEVDVPSQRSSVLRTL
ncbi:MAG TPA: hypothetical protein VIG32_03105 [Candidatus Baltobacteraceae bacterium]